MGWVPFRQRGGALGGQYVDTARPINTLRIGAVPRPLTQSDNPRHHARSDFGINLYFTTAIEDPHHIAIADPSPFSIHRVNPHLLKTGGFQHIYVTVGGVGSGLVVEAG